MIASVLLWAAAHRRATAAIAGVSVVALASAGTAGWAVWKLTHHQVVQAQAQTRAATSNADARGLEVRGAQATAERVVEHTRVVRQVQTRTQTVIQEILSEPSINAPLPASRADRLRDHDRFLCDARPPVVCAPGPSHGGGGDAAAGANAGGGGDAVRPLHPAGDAE